MSGRSPIVSRGFGCSRRERAHALAAAGREDHRFHANAKRSSARSQPSRAAIPGKPLKRRGAYAIVTAFNHPQLVPAASRRSIIAFWLVLGLARQTFAQDLCLVPSDPPLVDLAPPPATCGRRHRRRERSRSARAASTSTPRAMPCSRARSRSSYRRARSRRRAPARWPTATSTSRAASTSSAPTSRSSAKTATTTKRRRR